MVLVLTDKAVADMTQEELLLQCVREYADQSNYELYEKDLGSGHIVEIMPAMGSARGDNGDYARQALVHYEKRKKAAQLSEVEQVALEQHRILGMLIDSTDFERLSQFMQEEIVSTYERGKKWK